MGFSSLLAVAEGVGVSEPEEGLVGVVGRLEEGGRRTKDSAGVRREGLLEERERREEGDEEDVAER